MLARNRKTPRIVRGAPEERTTAGQGRYLPPAPVRAAQPFDRATWPAATTASVVRPSGTKLHVGCGGKVLPGWLNTDAKPGVGPDGVVDLSNLQLPAGYFDSIYACHVLEHCWPEETPGILSALRTALQPHGTLLLAVPDLRLIVANCVDGHTFGMDPNPPLFGNLRKSAPEWDRHRQAFWAERLEQLLLSAGLVNVRQWLPSQYPDIAALRDWSSYPTITLNMAADAPDGARVFDRHVDLVAVTEDHPDALDVSVLLGTVNRAALLEDCIASIRSSLSGSGLRYEIVVAYGTDDESTLPWMRLQQDIVPVCGGMQGAIHAFNVAYRVSRGRYVCQLNDDVQVDGKSIAIAVQHLEDDRTSAGVVFKFDRGDGQGYRHAKLHGGLHPNQLVARREACEAVVERIGGFWGNEDWRTDKTYGGDSAFGVLCIHLGLRLDSVPGVTCRDRVNDSNDGLRARNSQLRAGHGDNWRAMYLPLQQTPATAPGADEWPHVYLPRPSMLPRRSPVLAGPPERVLHLSQRTDATPQHGFTHGVSTLGPYRQIPWTLQARAHGVATMERNVLDAIREHQPTLIFSQVQGGEWPTLDFQNAMRAAAPAGCLLANFTGDVRTRAGEPLQDWQVRICQGLDLFLATNCEYPVRLRQEYRVPCATGYLLCGTDAEENPFVPCALPDEWADSAGQAVFVGNRHPWAGDRDAVLLQVQQRLPGRLHAYGSGWTGAFGHAAIPRDARGRLHAAASVVVGASAFTCLRRYTSGRFADALHTGAVYAFQAFPDWQGTGVRNGVHALAWHDADELADLLRDWLRPERAADRLAMRRAAHALAVQEMAWPAVMENLLAIVRDLRARRQQ